MASRTVNSEQSLFPAADQKIGPGIPSAGAFGHLIGIHPYVRTRNPNGFPSSCVRAVGYLSTTYTFV